MRCFVTGCSRGGTKQGSEGCQFAQEQVKVHKYVLAVIASLSVGTSLSDNLAFGVQHQVSFPVLEVAGEVGGEVTVVIKR